ncbi:unnamed protein product [Calypogeia fissa]
MAAAGAAATIRWWSNDTVAVVTGSNKGIGFEIVRGLAKQGITTVLTARDQTRGRKAQSKLTAVGLSVAFHQLDVSNKDSIESFTSWLEKEYGGLDILINNAGILVPEVSNEIAKAVLETNFFGPKRLTQKLLPLLRPSPFGSRIVNVSSRLGQLYEFKNEAVIKHLKDNVEELDEPTLDSIAQQYLEDVKSGAWRSRGWETQCPQYAESKLFLNGYTRLVARSLLNRPDGHKVYVNAICPGYIRTDLTKNTPVAQPVVVGADTPVWLALSQNGATGKFFGERREIDF